MDRIRYNANGDATSFEGRGAVEVFRAAALASGLRLYARTGIRPNRAWTPKAMMAAAHKITGHVFKARDYEVAALDLDRFVQTEKARIAAAVDADVAFANAAKASVGK